MKSNDIQQMIDAIVKLQAEATAIRAGLDFNDSGYKQKAYKDKMNEIAEYRAKISKLLDNKDDFEKRIL